MTKQCENLIEMKLFFRLFNFKKKVKILFHTENKSGNFN